MLFCRKSLIPIIVAGVVLSIGVGLSVAYWSAPIEPTKTEDSDANPNGNNSGTNVTNGTDVGISDGELKKDSCEPDNTSDQFEDTSGTIINTDKNTIGNLIGVEKHAAVKVQTLKDPKEKVSFRFTAKYSGDIQSLAINLLQASSNQTGFQVGLQQDDGSGKPNGEWIAKPEMGNSLRDSNGFVTIVLDEPARLEKDKVYHLIIETTELATNADSQLRIKSFGIYAPYQPFNDENPVVPWSDKMMNVLYFDGAGWKERNNWPVFVGRYADGRTIGQPYSLLAQWVTYGDRMFGQELIPSSNFVVDQIGFSVAARGMPADRLCYEVRDSNNDVLAQGMFAERDELATIPAFLQVKLEHPVTLEEGKLYRFVLFSPETKIEEPYHVYGFEYSYDKNIGYGGVQNSLTASFDSGVEWLRWEDADSVFTLSGPQTGN